MSHTQPPSKSVTELWLRTPILRPEQFITTKPVAETAVPKLIATQHKPDEQKEGSKENG